MLNKSAFVGKRILTWSNTNYTHGGQNVCQNAKQ